MNLLLVSGGLTTDPIIEAFRNNLPNKPEETKLIFIGTDTNNPFYTKAINYTKQTLNKIGIKTTNITVYNLYDETNPTINKYDVVIMLGGSLSEYMNRIHQLGLYDELDQFVLDGGFYVGASAGGMITGPSFDASKVSNHPNDADVTDFHGFSWVDFVLIPHWASLDNPEKTYDYHRESGCKMLYISDQQAILIHNDYYKII